jgi:hypothetical protein
MRIRTVYSNLSPSDDDGVNEWVWMNECACCILETNLTSSPTHIQILLFLSDCHLSCLKLYWYYKDTVQCDIHGRLITMLTYILFMKLISFETFSSLYIPVCLFVSSKRCPFKEKSIIWKHSALLLLLFE